MILHITLLISFRLFRSLLQSTRTSATTQYDVCACAQQRKDACHALTHCWWMGVWLTPHLCVRVYIHMNVWYVYLRTYIMYLYVCACACICMYVYHVYTCYLHDIMYLLRNRCLWLDDGDAVVAGGAVRHRLELREVPHRQGRRDHRTLLPLLPDRRHRSLHREGPQVNALAGDLTDRASLYTTTCKLSLEARRRCDGAGAVETSGRCCCDWLIDWAVARPNVTTPSWQWMGNQWLPGESKTISIAGDWIA